MRATERTAACPSRQDGGDRAERRSCETAWRTWMKVSRNDDAIAWSGVGRDLAAYRSSDRLDSWPERSHLADELLSASLEHPDLPPPPRLPDWVCRSEMVSPRWGRDLPDRLSRYSQPPVASSHGTHPPRQRGHRGWGGIESVWCKMPASPCVKPHAARRHRGSKRMRRSTRECRHPTRFSSRTSRGNARPLSIPAERCGVAPGLDTSRGDAKCRQLQQHAVALGIDAVLGAGAQLPDPLPLMVGPST